MRYNAADAAMAANPNDLSVAYAVRDGSTPLDNPLGLPTNKWAFFPEATIVSAPRTAQSPSLHNRWDDDCHFQSADHLRQDHSRYDFPVLRLRSKSSVVLATKPQGTYVRILEPQVAARFFVLDAATNGYAYVDSAAVQFPVTPPA
jgi:hypothetical protein